MTAIGQDPTQSFPTQRASETLTEEMLETGRALEKSGLVRGRSGNLSARTDDGFLITAAGACLGALKLSDVVVAESGDSPARASSEIALHAAVYTARPDVAAIVHTHSPYATAWSCVGPELLLELEEATYYGMGNRVAVTDHVPAGTLELARQATHHLGSGAAVLLARHGAVVAGPDLTTALCIAQSLEHQAQVAWLLR